MKIFKSLIGVNHRNLYSGDMYDVGLSWSFNNPEEWGQGTEERFFAEVQPSWQTIPQGLTSFKKLALTEIGYQIFTCW